MATIKDVAKLAGVGVGTASRVISGKGSFSEAAAADAPMCAECGSIMTRTGSCYKCGNCGGTSGCS